MAYFGCWIHFLDQLGQLEIRLIFIVSHQ